MSCANSFITLCSVAILALTLWPSMLSQSAAKWVIIIATILIVIAVWVGCECKCTRMQRTKK